MMIETNENKDEPPLAKARVAAGGEVGVMETLGVRRPVVGSIAWLDVNVELLVKGELVMLPIVGLNATIVNQIINRPVDRIADRGTAAKATCRIGEAPTATRRRGTQRILKRSLLGDGERPRTLGTENGFKGGIIAAPNQREMARLIVEEALVAESGVIRVGLIEYVGMSTRRALDDRALDKGLLSQAALLTSNENKMSDGGRGRASPGVNVWKSSQKWSAQRSAVRSPRAATALSCTRRFETRRKHGSLWGAFGRRWKCLSGIGLEFDELLLELEFQLLPF